MSDRSISLPPSRSPIESPDIDLPDDAKFGVGSNPPDGDISYRFDPSQGANGALVFRDEVNGEDRLYIPLSAAVQLVSQNLDVNSLDIEDGAQTIYNATDGEVLNAVVAGLANLGANDAFSQYPLLPADVFQLANLADGDQFSAYPIEAADVAESTIAVTDFGIGTVADGEAVGNSGGSLTGVSTGGGADNTSLFDLYLRNYATFDANTGNFGQVSYSVPNKEWQLRCPGDAGDSGGNWAYWDCLLPDGTDLTFDPTATASVQMNISNITADNNEDARIVLTVGKGGSIDGSSGPNIGFYALIEGNGDVRITNIDSQGSTNSEDTTQNNAYVSSLNYVKISWDGTTSTLEVDNGTTTVTVTETSNYPDSGNLEFAFKAVDGGPSTAVNIDYDVDDVVRT